MRSGTAQSKQLKENNVRNPVGYGGMLCTSAFCGKTEKPLRLPRPRHTEIVTEVAKKCF